MLGSYSETKVALRVLRRKHAGLIEIWSGPQVNGAVLLLGNAIVVASPLLGYRLASYTWLIWMGCLVPFLVGFALSKASLLIIGVPTMTLKLTRISTKLTDISILSVSSVTLRVCYLPQGFAQASCAS